MNKKKISVFGIIVLLFQPVFSQEIQKYFFTAHTAMGEAMIDYRLEQLDKSCYDQIWLGGDLCSETLMSFSTLVYLEEHLEICKDHNFLSFGNHDKRNGNMDYWESFTNKKSYYADYFNGITVIVLDTNLAPDDCENLNNQYEIICNVTDTIEQSSHLVLLFHWGLWNGVPGLPDPITYCHADMVYWNSNCDSTNNNFSQSIYPKLVEVKNRGVEVICIMGDMGANYKKIDFRSTDDIVFLGCGLYNMMHRFEQDSWWTYEKDLILELEHNIDERKITWKYRDLDSILFVQDGFTYLQKLTFDDYQNYASENMYFVSNENYLYKFNGNADSLIVLDTLLSQDTEINNDFYLTSVLKSSAAVAGEQVEIVFRLLLGESVIDEQTVLLSDISTSLRYYIIPINFLLEPTIGHKIQICVRNVCSVPVYMNNLTIMFEN